MRDSKEYPISAAIRMRNIAEKRNLLLDEMLKKQGFSLVIVYKYKLILKHADLVDAPPETRRIYIKWK